jgi:hypothetical protein
VKQDQDHSNVKAVLVFRCFHVAGRMGVLSPWLSPDGDIYFILNWWDRSWNTTTSHPLHCRVGLLDALFVAPFQRYMYSHRPSFWLLLKYWGLLPTARISIKKSL